MAWHCKAVVYSILRFKGCGGIVVGWRHFSRRPIAGLTEGSMALSEPLERTRVTKPQSRLGHAVFVCLIGWGRVVMEGAPCQATSMFR